MSQPHPNVRAVAPGTAPAAHHAIRTALVVDDSASARHRAATLLRLGGWHVVEAVGMDAALQLASIVEFDLVVPDMRCARHLRRRAGSPPRAPCGSRDC